MEQMVSGDIGGRLRRAREQRGLTLRDAAQRTRLSIAVLQAIERNDFASLPAGMFRKAYVRTLAAEVGLDPDAMAAAYRAQFEPSEPLPAPDQDAALQQRWLEQLTPLPSLRRSVATLAPLVAIAAAWFGLAPGSAGPGAPGDGAGDEIAVPMPLDVPAAIAGGDPRPVATPTAVAAGAAVPLRIDLVATSWCWVDAAADGARVVYRLVAPGERVVVEGRGSISLRLGDAGAVTLSINDGPRRPPGGDGEVVDIAVTPDNVERQRGGAAGARSGA